MKKIFLSEMFSFYNNKNRIVQCTVFQKSFFLYVIIPKGRNLNIQECQSAKFLSKLEFVFDCCLNFPEDKGQKNVERNRKMDKKQIYMYHIHVKYPIRGCFCLLQWQRSAMRNRYLQKVWNCCWQYSKTEKLKNLQRETIQQTYTQLQTCTC